MYFSFYMLWCVRLTCIGLIKGNLLACFSSVQSISQSTINVTWPIVLCPHWSKSPSAENSVMIIHKYVIFRYQLLDLSKINNGWSLAFLPEPGSARYSSAPSITTVWSNYQTSYNDFFMHISCWISVKSIMDDHWQWLSFNAKLACNK